MKTIATLILGLFGGSSRLLVIAFAVIIVIAIVFVFIMVLRSDSNSDSKTARGLARDIDEGPMGKPADNRAVPGSSWNSAAAVRPGLESHRPNDFGGTVGSTNANAPGPRTPSRPQTSAPAWNERPPAGWGEEPPAPAWGQPQPDAWNAQRPAPQPAAANPNAWGQPSSPTPFGGRPDQPFQPAGWPEQPNQPLNAPNWGQAAPQQDQGWAMPGPGQAAPQQDQGWAMPGPGQAAPQQDQGWAMPGPGQQPQRPMQPSPWGDQQATPQAPWQGAPSQPIPPIQQGAPAWGMPSAPQRPSPSPWGDPQTQQPSQQAPAGWGAAPNQAPVNDPAAAWRGTNAPEAPAVRPEARIAYVIIREGKEPGRTFELRKERMSIGRSRESEIFLEDLAVSRLHSSIYRDEQGGYVLRDENSANGTSVNGQRVSEHRLNDGDEIQVGQTIMTFTRR